MLQAVADHVKGQPQPAAAAAGKKDDGKTARTIYVHTSDLKFVYTMQLPNAFDPKSKVRAQHVFLFFAIHCPALCVVTNPCCFAVGRSTRRWRCAT